MTEVIKSSPTSSSLHNFDSQPEEKQKRVNSRNSDRAKLCSEMDIGWPTNVRHVAHVTFDRFNGFLGLPVEFEPQVPSTAPSASTTVFGVSTQSMQLSYDHRGNSVPTILLLMQQRLYDQGGLQAEGIFRINADNGQEEFVRNQLNAGVVPVGIDVHCLAGLIKAWFRELPAGVLDTLSPEQVMQCQTEEDCSALLRLLPPTEAALLDWAINLMADVVQQEHLNKMNTSNIAMVFAPNMTQMADQLTALMYAVQVMNFLKALISKTLKERENFILQASPGSQVDPADENGRQGALQLCREVSAEEDEVKEQSLISEDPQSDTLCDNQVSYISDEEYLSYTTRTEDSDGGGYGDTLSRNSSVGHSTESSLSSAAKSKVEDNAQGSIIGQSSKSNYIGKISEKISGQQIVVQALGSIGGKEISNLSRKDLSLERIEAWR
ncbi:Rho GTPase-activating protein 1 [Heracleum sosnowskyi]|uniref:Rho GTPase-activating protein 1 n=1 Tax=Heracleum sosnowskyi TaxID=360622 RepID=A0AAD8J025_9APIA|nr:Rho GTPase-activating protein 1 [Heracleum sosnowskyi]